METFILLFLGWALTSLLVNGSIFDPLRNYLLVMYPFFGKLLSCIQCTGVWVGALIFIPLVASELATNIYPILWVNYIAYPVIQSGFSVLVESFIIWLVKNSRIEK
jgi:hypothetical protein